MRLALVISSSYTESSVVTPREAFVDTSLLAQSRLSQQDTAFSVVTLAANRDLPERLEQLLAEHEGKLDELLIHFTGYVAVKSDRGPALLLDGGRLRAFPLSRLRSAITQIAPQVLVVMDVVAMADDGVQAGRVAADIGHALHDLTPHVSVVTSASLPAHADPNRRGCMRLTDLWLLSMGYEALHAPDALVFVGPVVRNLQSERISFSDLSSFDYQRGEQDFLLIPGPQVGGYAGGHASLNASTQRSADTPSSRADTEPTASDVRAHHPYDTYTDELAPASSRPTSHQATPGAWVDSDRPTPIPSVPRAATFDLPLPPLPPPIGIPVPPPGAKPLGDEWAERASYLPSVPPPTVLPKLPTPPPHTPRAQLPSTPATSGQPTHSFVSSADVVTMEQLVEAADRQGDAFLRIEQREKLALFLESAPRQKGQVLFEAAEIAASQMNDIGKAYELITRAVAADAQNVESFGLCLQILLRTQRHTELIQRCTRVLTDSVQPDLRYLASTQLLALFEIPGISFNLDVALVERLRQAVSDDPALRVKVDRAVAPPSVMEETLLLIQETLQNDARHLQSLQALSDVAEHEHAYDTASLVSSIVMCLNGGRAEDAERAARIFNDGLPTVTRTLVDGDVAENLLGSVANIAQLRALSAAVKPALAAGLCKEPGKNDLPKEATILDPVASTTTLARSLDWTARFVGVATPALVLVPELDAPMVISVCDEPRLLINKQLGSGFGLAQLAFLGARYLCFLRPELVWRVAFETQERAAQTLNFCVRFANQGNEFWKQLDDDERKAAKRFCSYLEDDASLAAHLTNNFAGFEIDPAMFAELATAWSLAADRAALRIGLLACASPPSAWQLTTQMPHRGVMSLDAQLEEIASFTISQGHQVLRQSLGLLTNGR